MSDDVTTAATIASLREQVDKLLWEVGHYKAENVQLTNRQTMDREEIESMGRRNDELREDLANARKWIDGHDVRSDFPNATAMRQALDTARERAGVLEREVRKWRDVNEKAQAVRKVYQQHGGGALVEMLKRDAEASLRVCIEETMKETDRTHALDAAKFGKEQNDG